MPESVIIVVKHIYHSCRVDTGVDLDHMDETTPSKCLVRPNDPASGPADVEIRIELAGGVSDGEKQSHQALSGWFPGD